MPAPERFTDPHEVARYYRIPFAAASVEFAVWLPPPRRDQVYPYQGWNAAAVPAGRGFRFEDADANPLALHAVPSHMTVPIGVFVNMLDLMARTLGLLPQGGLPQLPLAPPYKQPPPGWAQLPPVPQLKAPPPGAYERQMGLMPKAKPGFKPPPPARPGYKPPPLEVPHYRLYDPTLSPIIFPGPDSPRSDISVLDV